MSATTRFHGLQFELRQTAGARALRVVHPAGQVIPAHRHDWPLITIPALGSYDEEGEDGSVMISGPTATFHPAGCCHANCIHDRGMETVSIEFDPDWLSLDSRHARPDRSHYWFGGATSLKARSLAALWSDPKVKPSRLRQATAQFIIGGIEETRRSPPQWVGEVMRRTQGERDVSTAQLANGFDRHPGWLAHAYRAAAGEGLQEAIRRRKAEHAAHLLRSTDHAIAAIAIDTGFCDQSHLHRTLRRITGRTPLQIRQEGRDLDALFESA